MHSSASDGELRALQHMESQSSPESQAGSSPQEKIAADAGEKKAGEAGVWPPPPPL